MKWFYRLFSIGILLAALSLPFYADYKANGDFLSLQSFADSAKNWMLSGKNLLSEVTSSKAETTSNAEAIANDGSNTVYRWQDASGQWHFSDAAPEQTERSNEVEKIQVKPEDLQTISAMDEALIEQTNQADSRSNTSSASTQKATLDDTLSFDNAINIMQNAQDASALMQERNNALREIVGE